MRLTLQQVSGDIFVLSRQFIKAGCEEGAVYFVRGHLFQLRLTVRSYPNWHYVDALVTSPTYLL